MHFQLSEKLLCEVSRWGGGGGAAAPRVQFISRSWLYELGWHLLELLVDTWLRGGRNGPGAPPAWGPFFFFVVFLCCCCFFVFPVFCFLKKTKQTQKQNKQNKTIIIIIRRRILILIIIINKKTAPGTCTKQIYKFLVLFFVCFVCLSVFPTSFFHWRPFSCPPGGSEPARSTKRNVREQQSFAPGHYIRRGFFGNVWIVQFGLFVSGCAVRPVIYIYIYIYIQAGLTTLNPAGGFQAYT